ncbi:MAG: hypothetical protein HND52_14935 [Ignavibacteriae bacterium]|nr:hypothetical protein [Ignavibacteriota bacterium]NOG99249.1 hypothetical protein [Ignavibacteriota bacterium]
MKIHRIYSAKSDDESGYVLSSVLIVGVLLTSFLMSLFVIIIAVQNSALKRLNKKKIDLACQSAIQTIISEDRSAPFITETLSFKFDSITVETNCLQKGLFQEILVTGKYEGDSSQVIYMLGGKQPEPFSNALIQSRGNLRSTVAGNTFINGDILATSKKFSVGRITGLGRTTMPFYKGTITSQDSIPSKLLIDSSYNSLYDFESHHSKITTSQEYFLLNEPNYSNRDKEVNEINTYELELDGKIYSEEYSPVFRILVKGIAKINEATSSNIDLEIFSDSTVTIEGNVSLENCIIVSKDEVYINKNSSFRNVQFFSKKGITIDGCEFLYPSIISVNGELNESTRDTSNLIITNSIINGMLLLTSNVIGLDANKSKISVDKKSLVHGMIYSENNLELHGTLNGTAYTYNTYYYKKPTEYLNWLVNISIDRSKLDKNFLLPLGFKQNIKMKILGAEWLH